jgi:hypothetical protein
VLLALSRRGIGGPFRSGYLRRRLSRETGGEIAIEALSGGEEVNTTRRRAWWRSAYVACPDIRSPLFAAVTLR